MKEVKGVGLTLTKEKSEEIFFNALCNGLDYFCSGYDFQWDIDDTYYQAAKTKLKDPCREDVIMQALRDGGSLKMIDKGGENEYTKEISLVDVHNKVQTTPFKHLVDMLEEEDDAITADVVLQTVFFGEIIFG